MNPTAAAARPNAAQTAPRFDMYAAIHKALRHFMTDTLHRVGRLDVADAEQTGRVLGQLDALLTLCVDHVHNENRFVHTAIEARQPGGAGRTTEDHVEHLESIETLRAEGRALGVAPQADRALLALRLYRHLALFVAENLQHMHFEETHNNAVLWACYSDAELFALHQQIIASLPLEETLLVARWMIPACTPAERAAIVGGMKAGAPAPVFDQIVDAFRPHLDDTAWGQLARAVGIAQQPGLVDFR
ncbi:MAG: hypothetical protein KIT35_06045 [Piscinibacter sp.]|uniref:hemerythrin domain-containing protein n=1 Tax=Piscinibacter TaxID=1114981 RepID=UPI000FDDCD24|nr:MULTISPECIES: hypothetical protein [Piscinibacter]MCW5663374.1 hypothetical protein [Piscinibacter sp.]